MHGGAGSDSYMVNDLGDKIVELGTDDGVDSVFATVDHTLAEDVESLFLMGSEAINGTGNWDDNYIKGNDADNIIDGKGGSDLLDGGDGDDVYYVYDPEAYVTESGAGSTGGIDTVYSATYFFLDDMIENLVLTGHEDDLGMGNDWDNQITGNMGHNHLHGGAGADTLSGGVGYDMLDGGAGADTYVLTAPTGEDYDFLYFDTDDRLAVVGSVYGLSRGALDSTRFVGGSEATGPDGTGQFVFDAAEQILMWDSDGSGAEGAVWIASFEEVAAFDHTDFVVL